MIPYGHLIPIRHKISKSMLPPGFSRSIGFITLKQEYVCSQAKDRIQYYQTGEEFIFPYDLGSRWENFKQVFTWSGTPMGDGIEWPVHEKCNQYTLTVCAQHNQSFFRLYNTVKYSSIAQFLMIFLFLLYSD